MKYSFLFLTCLIVSCGKYESEVSRNLIGETRSATALSVSSSDRNNLASICGALAQKSTILPSIVGTTNFLFTTIQTDCEGETVVNADINVVVQNSGAGLVFKKSIDGLDYIFPEVETQSSGLLAGVCADLSTFSNPRLEGTSATWITTSGISSNDCTPLSGEICVMVEKGNLNNDQTYTVHTKEWMRVRVSSIEGKLGFFTERKRLTQSICEANKSQISRAILK